MQGRSIYKLEPRLRSMSKAEGNFWVPNAAITEHALTRRLGELDREKTMVQADYRYRQRELQKELRNIRASKQTESSQRSQTHRFSNRNSTDPTSLTDMIDRFKKKRTDQEYLHDQLRQRRDSLVSSIGNKHDHSPDLLREETTASDMWDNNRPCCPEPPAGTILDDMRTALTMAKHAEGLATKNKEAGLRRPRESRIRRSKHRDVTYPKGLSLRSSKRRPHEAPRTIKDTRKTQSRLVTLPNPSIANDGNGEDINTDLLESVKADNTSETHFKSTDDGTILTTARGPHQNKDDANMTTNRGKDVVSKSILKEGQKMEQCVGLGLQRKEKQLTKEELESNTNLITRRCSEPVIIGERENIIEHLNVNMAREYVPEETIPGFKKHIIVRRFSENDKYQCNFIKDLIDDDECSMDSDKETVEISESDIIWDDVRRCRYLRGYDPPIMIMPKEEINLFVFGRDENDILELKREKHFGL
ncbi:uncharacterized protein LOC117315558 [Pecten maximus]|uniref:uncharacterized protein LOC117315558 n=1 Tax=Pecten maximus TaxID=6579 RepID=UPI00145918B4|nr:uncharacterized protein LOC117315558 [Pecten maximus]